MTVNIQIKFENDSQEEGRVMRFGISQNLSNIYYFVPVVSLLFKVQTSQTQEMFWVYPKTD